MEVFIADSWPGGNERLAALLSGLAGVHIAGEARSPQAAIASILKKKPDLVLLGLKLGEGFDVLREVRAREPGIDFYVLANYSSKPFERYAERLGALAYFDRSAGLAAVREAIAARH